MTITILDILLVFLPSVIGYGSQYLCNIGKNAGKNVLFRPPSWVFGIVWPVLFLLFGIFPGFVLQSHFNGYFHFL